MILYDSYARSDGSHLALELAAPSDNQYVYCAKLNSVMFAGLVDVLSHSSRTKTKIYNDERNKPPQTGDDMRNSGMNRFCGDFS